MQKLVSPLSVILFAVLLRLIPHPPNVAPIAAMALFSSYYLNKKYALIVPLVALLVSDIFLGFHSTMVFVYGSFFLVGLIGIVLRSYKTPLVVFSASLGASLLFFMITNFGVWLVGGLYPHTLNGLVRCYTLGLPFLRNTMVGDLFYTGLFFGSYKLIQHVVRRTNRYQLLKIK